MKLVQLFAAAFSVGPLRVRMTRPTRDIECSAVQYSGEWSEVSWLSYQRTAAVQSL
jgi:hypothetical protein